MPTTLQGIANKSRREKKYRFRNLYRALDERFLTESWFTLNKHAAPGIDRVTVRKFGDDLKANVGELVTALKEKRYRAQLVRKVDIPKGGGKFRSLGIPVVADRLVQAGASRILTAIHEEDFLP